MQNNTHLEIPLSVPHENVVPYEVIVKGQSIGCVHVRVSWRAAYAYRFVDHYHLEKNIL